MNGSRLLFKFPSVNYILFTLFPLPETSALGASPPKSPMLNRCLVKRNIMRKAYNFNFGILRYAFGDFRVTVLFFTMHRLKSLDPCVSAYSCMITFMASLPGHVMLNGLMEFPVGGTGDCDASLDREMLGEGCVLIFTAMLLPEDIQEIIFR
jgi:hypothetical protein